MDTAQNKNTGCLQTDATCCPCYNGSEASPINSRSNLLCCRRS
uniref:Short-chain dehydrogenase n=1 Tax=Rhizophora mucronata TaxID=61149 RepID=A0A2P2LEN4_RHIMU